MSGPCQFFILSLVTGAQPRVLISSGFQHPAHEHPDFRPWTSRTQQYPVEKLFKVISSPTSSSSGRSSGDVDQSLHSRGGVIERQRMGQGIDATGYSGQIIGL